MGHQGHFGIQHAHNRIDLTDLQRFLPGHIRKDRRQPFGQHAFSGARRANEQHIMAACRRDFQGALYILLPQHILEVRLLQGISLRKPQRLLLQNSFSIQPLSQFLYIMDRIHRRTSGKGRFRGIFRRNEQRLDPLPLSGKRHGQHTANRPQLPVQRHLTEKSRGHSGSADTAGSRQNT